MLGLEGYMPAKIAGMALGRWKTAFEKFEGLADANGVRVAIHAPPSWRLSQLLQVAQTVCR